MSLCNVCMLSSLPIFLPVFCALRVLCSVPYSWPPSSSLYSFSTRSKDTYVTVPINLRITLFICLNSSSIWCSLLWFLCMCVWTCIRISHPFHTHTHWLPYSYACFALCSLLIPIFFFASSFSTDLMLLCHGAYWCTHNPDHMPRLLPICIFVSLTPAYVNLNMYTHNPAHRAIFLYYYTYTHLPPSSRTLMLVYKHTCICQNILLLLFFRNPFFPYIY